MGGRADRVPDLFDYFQRIFARIWADKKYRQDTARIFRTCLKAAQPLPIEVIQVIVQSSPQYYAIQAPVTTSYTWDTHEMIDRTRAQVNGRCQDLLSIAQRQFRSPSEHNEYTLVLGTLYRVEFLHRTVQDFLVQSPSVLADLQDHAGEDFDTPSTLLACYVWLIKRAGSIVSSRNNTSLDYIDMLAMGWSTEGLLHAFDAPADSTTAKLIEELDHAMSKAYTCPRHVHWSNGINPTGARERHGRTGESGVSVDLYVSEHGQRDYIAHLVQFSLLDEVKTRLAANPALVRNKKGRPYLDYALRCHAGTFKGADERQRAWLVQRSRNLDMVEYLLGLGCDVNSPISIYDCHSIWYLYLRSLCLDSEHPMTRTTDQSEEKPRQVTWRLIQHGTKDVQRCFLESRPKSSAAAKYPHETVTQRKMSARDILVKIFGEDEGSSMHDAVLRNETVNSWRSPLTYLTRLWGQT